MTAHPCPLVVKVGGRELLPGPSLSAVGRSVADSVRAGRTPVLVHGGGEEVSERCSALGLPVERRRGQRVTTDPVRKVVIEVLAGRVNQRLVAALQREGISAVGLAGSSGGMLSVRPAGDPPGALGWVGLPTSVDTRLLSATSERGLVPVVAPLGLDGTGEVFNVNADLAAAAIAGALGAEMILLTDVAAVRDARGRAIAALTPSEATRLIADGTAREGMIPKLEAAVDALERGARSAWIGDLSGWTDRSGGSPSGTLVRSEPRARRPVPVLPRGEHQR